MITIKYSTPKNIKAEIEKKLAKYKSATVNVGFLKGTYPNGVSFGDVAFWNEFGTWNIPPRPFFTTCVEKNNKIWGNTFTALSKKDSAPVALKRLGVVIKQDIQQSIEEFDTPENAYVTIHGGKVRTKFGKIIIIKGKGFDDPLIHTGAMRNSVDWEYKENKK